MQSIWSDLREQEREVGEKKKLFYRDNSEYPLSKGPEGVAFISFKYAI